MNRAGKVLIVTPTSARGEDLLAQDVGMPAVLGQLAQHVQEDPAQRQGAATVAVHHLPEAEGGDGGEGEAWSLTKQARAEADVVPHSL